MHPLLNHARPAPPCCAAVNVVDQPGVWEQQCINLQASLPVRFPNLMWQSAARLLMSHGGPGLHVACMRALPAAFGVCSPATHTCPPSTLPAEQAGGWRSRHCSLPDRRTAQQRMEERRVCCCPSGGCTGHGPAGGMSGNAMIGAC